MLARRHIDEVVRIHLQSFPSFFLSFLGSRFLREFYSSFLVDPTGVGYVVIDDDGKVVGAVVGPVDPRGYFQRLLKHRWWAFCVASIGAVLRRPTIIPRLWQALFYRGESPGGAGRALLSSIAVAPAAQGCGAGRLLVQAWLAEAWRRGASGAYLTTDTEANEAVNRFYCGLGWALETSYVTREGRRMNRYIFDFPPLPKNSG
ncbi:MAG: GNAT family N-acetyltransferase [Verrucomicrobia bacterium]|nr:GNAT family N-acetyltransferase [Verrucomicrobiota bacterium]